MKYVIIKSRTRGAKDKKQRFRGGAMLDPRSSYPPWESDPEGFFKWVEARKTKKWVPDITFKSFVILEKANKDKYYYIDFDRTLAHHVPGQDINVLGEPIPKMMNRVKKLLAQGKKVKIFTARASFGKKAIKNVQDWLEDHGLPRLEVTNVKLDDVLEIWDDKAKEVKPNKGEIK